MNRKNMLAAVALVAPTAGYVNTHAGAILYVCATPQNTILDAAAYAALTWVKVGNVGNHGETGAKTNILTYDTWDTTVSQKQKGTTNAGDPSVEVARDPADPGQIILRTAGAPSNKNNYAFKIVGTDKPNDDVDSRATTTYNRGLVTGPTRPKGKNEDFDLEVFTLALNQLEIVVDPIDGTA